MADAARIEKVETIITALEEALLTVGPAQISVDGQLVKFQSRKELREELAMWRKELARLKGERRVSRGVDLGGAWA